MEAGVHEKNATVAGEGDHEARRMPDGRLRLDGLGRRRRSPIITVAVHSGPL